MGLNKWITALLLFMILKQPQFICFSWLLFLKNKPIVSYLELYDSISLIQYFLKCKYFIEQKNSCILYF